MTVNFNEPKHMAALFIVGITAIPGTFSIVVSIYQIHHGNMWLAIFWFIMAGVFLYASAKMAGRMGELVAEANMGEP